MYRRAASRGFTLLELLVVVAIIGLLSAIVLTVLNQARVKGRDSKRVGDVRQVQTALSVYFDGHSAYPPDLTSLIPQYLPVMPVDPNTGAQYFYEQIGTGSSYHLGANMELKGDVYKSNSDKDSVTNSINGIDSGDCAGGSSGRWCYDVVP